MSDAPAIYEALAAVMDDVQAVAKRDRNDHQKFMFRGIDAVMNAVGPALRTRRVIVTPDVQSVTYEQVTTSTGKPSTACRVRVAYTFYATDGSSISTSVAGEAWDHGDKACPKAMSVAFRTALLQALCLPTDEPDPDTQTYERAPVDLAPLRKVIAAAKARDIEGDYDGLAEWAAESQQNAEAAIRKLQRTVDEYDSEAEDAAAQQGQRPEPADDEDPDDDGSADEGKPAWQQQAEAEGISHEQLLIGLQKAWPPKDQGAKPTRTSGLDAVADRHEGLYAKVIEDLAREQREAVA